MQITRFINSVFASNTFLIEGISDHREAFLIDCGDVQPIIRYLIEKELALKAVFITHSHYDHIYGLNELIKEYPEILVFTSFHGKDGLYSEKMNLSKYHSEAFVFQSDKVSVLGDKQVVQLFENVVLEVYETPGHDWSSLCYKLNSIIFTGDSYLPQYGVMTNFPKSNKMDAVKSLEKIKRISAGCDIYPGHGNIVYV